MIVNGQSLLAAAPIKNMLTGKMREHGVSYGLAEAGYDIRIKQNILFKVPRFNIHGHMVQRAMVIVDDEFSQPGNFTIASAIEEFQMPDNLVGVVHDKSTWARKGLSVFNTVIEPGWKGFLTLELVFRAEDEDLFIPAGAGIAQVLFTRVENHAAYAGKYQGQADRPVPAIMEKG
jgi:dCTP deaminase